MGLAGRKPLAAEEAVAVEEPLHIVTVMLLLPEIATLWLLVTAATTGGLLAPLASMLDVQILLQQAEQIALSQAL